MQKHTFVLKSLKNVCTILNRDTSIIPEYECKYRMQAIVGIKALEFDDFLWELFGLKLINQIFQKLF